MICCSTQRDIVKGQEFFKAHLTDGYLPIHGMYHSHIIMNLIILILKSIAANLFDFIKELTLTWELLIEGYIFWLSYRQKWLVRAGTQVNLNYSLLIINWVPGIQVILITVMDL